MLVLLLVPAAALAQDGTTPFLTIPEPLAKGESDIGGYVSIEDNIDLFGIYRRGFGNRLDGGLRAGYTEAPGCDGCSGGFNFGADFRYLIAGASQDLPLNFAFVANAQFSFLDPGFLFAIPFGVSLGAEIQAGEGRPLWLYGLPYGIYQYFNPDAAGFDSTSDFDVGAEIGAQLWLSGKLWLTGAFTVQNDPAFAIGLSYRE
jgi:hypothetical protein